MILTVLEKHPVVCHPEREAAGFESRDPLNSPESLSEVASLSGFGGSLHSLRSVGMTACRVGRTRERVE
jgi:hypothetical protein